MKLSGLSFFTRVVILVAFYFIGGLLGHEATFKSGGVALVWPPFGIALAALLLWGYRFWPGVALGALLFTFWNGNSFGFAAWGTAVGNTIGAVVCVFLLERFIQFRASLQRVRDVAGFIPVALFCGSVVSAVFTSVSLCYSGAVLWENLFLNVIQWWIPNALAGLVITPFILTWGSSSAIRWRWPLIIEALICTAGLVGGALISFSSWYSYGVQSYPLAYLPYPFLVWGALRFGQRGATAGTMVVAIIAINALLEGRGPFVMPNMDQSLVLLGSYIGILAISNLFLAGVAAEREQAMSALHDNEKRYRAVVQDQTDLICRFDLQGRITFVNEAYCSFHKKTPAELIGSPYMPSLPAEDQEIPLSVFTALTPQQPTLSFDDKLASPDGKVVWHQCTIHALFDENERINEFQSVVHDITSRKQLEDALRDREEFFRLISESMTDMIAVLDRDGKRIYNSPSYAALLGEPSRLAGTNSFLDVHPEDRESIKRIFQETISTGVGQRAQFRFVRKDGIIRFVESQGSVVRGKDGLPSQVVVVSRDVTERLNLETRLRQSQKMEAIGRLAGGIAHDFNNLMQAIIGYADFLLKRLTPEDPHHDTVVQIEKSADRAAALTAQLLAFSRKQILQPKVFSLEGTVGDVNKLLQRLIGANVQLLTRSAPGTGCICADPGQIEQVILNLSLNARDAMAGGGTLLIETSNVELTEKAEGFSEEFCPGPFVHLAISDTGAGMSAEVKSHLFEPFFTTKKLGEGTGLGLSIVYGIVRQSGGEISVVSEPGRGTTFHIYFPRMAGTVSEKAPGRAPAPVKTGGRESILLVEDEEIVRGMLADLLRAEGYTIMAAKHGPEAIEMAAQHAGPIDLLVTDMLMPDMTGGELATRLLATRPNLPVLYVSGYSDEEARGFGNFEGPAQFLQKPFRPDVLLARVREILNAQKNPAENLSLASKS